MARCHHCGADMYEERAITVSYNGQAWRFCSFSHLRATLNTTVGGDILTTNQHQP